MTVLVEMEDVAQPRHLMVFPSTTFSPPSIVRMEVYTGRIEANFRSGSGPVAGETFVSFLPISDQSEVFDYPTTTILDQTIAVTPTTFQDEDDPSVVAVDRTLLEIRQQNFPGFQANCLLLRTRVSAHQAHLISLTYHVTVLTAVNPRQPDLSILTLDANQAPIGP